MQEDSKTIIRSIVSKVIKVDEDLLSAEDDLIDKHGMDSMQRVEIIIEMEKKFDVVIPDDVGTHFRTIKMMAEYVACGSIQSQ